MPITQINNHNTQAVQVSTTSNRPVLNFLKAIIGDGAVFRLIEKLFVGRQTTIINQPLDLGDGLVTSASTQSLSETLLLVSDNPALRKPFNLQDSKGKKEAEDYWKKTVPLWPENVPDQAPKLRTEVQREVNKDNTFLLNFKKAVDELLIKVKKEGGVVENSEEAGVKKKNDTLIGEMIIKKVAAFFGEVEKYSSYLSANEKAGMQKLIEDTLMSAKNKIAIYRKPTAKLSSLLTEAVEIRDQQAQVDSKMMLPKALLRKKIAQLGMAEQQREVIHQEMDVLQKNNIAQLKRWETDSKALIRDAIVLLGEEQKKLDSFRSNNPNDKAGIKKAQEAIAGLIKLIEGEDKEVLTPVSNMLNNPTEALENLKQKFEEVEKNIQEFKNTEIRALIELEAERDVYSSQFEELERKLTSFIDREVSGGLFTFLDNIKAELALKQDYPSYQLLSTYNNMTPEELNDKHVDELYADYLVETRGQLERARVRTQQSAAPNPGF